MMTFAEIWKLFLFPQFGKGYRVIRGAEFLEEIRRILSD